MEFSRCSPILERWTQHHDKFGNRCLFIDNLDPSIDPINLLDTFSKFGKINTCEVARNQSNDVPTVQHQNSTLFGYAPFIEHINSKGLKLVVVKNDGNCLFRAISVCLFGNESKHYELRQKVANEMEKRGSKIQPFLSMPLEKYITKLRHSSFWAGQLELSLLQSIINSSIIILDADLVGNERRVDFEDDESSEGDTSDSIKVIYLSYHGQNHYNAILIQEQQNEMEFISKNISKNTGLCIFSNSLSVDRLMKLGPIYVLHRKLDLNRTPKNAPVVADLVCYTSDRSATASTSDSSDREFSEISNSFSPTSTTNNPTNTLKKSLPAMSPSSDNEEQATFETILENQKSPRFKPLKLSFHRKKNPKNQRKPIRSNSSTTTSVTLSSSITSASPSITTAAAAVAAAAMWKRVATFAVVIVLLLCVCIVYYQSKMVDVQILMKRLKILQKQIEENNRRPYSASNKESNNNVGIQQKPEL